MTSVIIEPTTTAVVVELVAVHTDYYYAHPAQTLEEHTQVGESKEEGDEP